jgi:outer membrane protein OmpA-like peptidoglycan-associated protein
MAKTRELLLAGSMLALAVGAMPVLAEPNVKLAQAQQQSEKDKDKAKQKGQPAKTQQPPAAKPATAPSQQQPPAARTAPSQPSQPPAARTPPQQPSQQPAARTPPSQPSQQPAARTQPPGGQTPSATQTPPGQQRGREQRPATVQQPGQPSGAQTQPSTQDKPGQRPAAREQAKPPTTQQPAQAPAAQPQPSTTQTQPSTTQPGQPGQRPAAREQRPTTTQQPGQAPTATQRPGQAPAAQDKPTTQPGQAPAQQAQPPASRQPPATGQQPTWQQQPAARTQPPAGQPSGGQPAVQDKLQPGMQPAPRQAVAPAPVGSQGQELRRVEDLRKERREVREGNRVVIREPDRMIIREGGRTIIRHNEADRFRRGGREIAVDRRGNEVMTVVERPDGTRIVTVVDNDGRLIRRARRTREGREIVIIDNRVAPRGSVSYFVDLPPPVVRIPRERYIVEADVASREDIYAALMAPPVDRIERRYSLDEVRYSPALRERMPRVDVDTITFESGSWELGPDQIDQLAVIADGINQALANNPSEVFLIEGHTDAVGPEEDNLSLSDRRAEAVAMALTEQFQVPAENLTTQGYGEQYLKIPTDGPERKNRRVSARRVTPLLNGDKSVGQAN